MVELTELKAVEDDHDEDYVTEDEDNVDDGFQSEDVDDDDDFESESLLERLSALVDVIPPMTRYQAYKSAKSTMTNAWAAGQFLGKGAWILATAGLLVVLPLGLEYERETFALQQENAQRLQQVQAQQVVQSAGGSTPAK